MAEYQGEYGHPYPRVDQYGNPVPPVDEYGNPVPREPPLAAGLMMGDTTAPVYGGAAGDTTAGAGYAAAAAAAPGGGDYGAAYPSGGVAPGEPALAYEGMVGGGGGVGATTATAGMLGGQLQPARAEEHTFGSCQLVEPTRSKEEHTTLGEKLTRSSSSSSSSSSEDDGQGGRRKKKKSIKEKIKEKLPGTHKQHEERKAGHAAPATTTGTTHAAGAHEKKGFIDKIKEKLPGHH